MSKQLPNDQISFYDETLKKHVEGSYRHDGKRVYVSSVKYGFRHAPVGSHDTFIDQDGVDLLAEKLLRQLAHDVTKNGKGTDAH
jgi:hypothetical protein